MSTTTTSWPCTKTVNLGFVIGDRRRYRNVFQSESYHKWMKEVNSIKGQQLDEKGMKDYIAGIKRKSIHKLITKTTEGAEQGNIIDKSPGLSYIAYEHSMNIGALVFFLIELGNYTEARLYLDKILIFISESLENGSIHRDHTQSFEYVFSNLELYGAIKELKSKVNEGGGEKEDIQESVKLFQGNIQNLSRKTKAGVYALKHYFYGLLRANHQIQIDIIREVIKLNPRFYQWHSDLRDVLRYQRRSGQYHHFHNKNYPSEEEKTSMIKANKLSLYNNPRCMTGEIHLLSEIIKAQNPSTSKYNQINFEYNKTEYKNLDRLVEYIWNQIEKILAFNSTSVRICTTIAEIITKLLPRRYKDQDFALDILLKCLEDHPCSSKTQHRVAEIYLTKRKFNTAQYHLEQAVEYSAHEGNFSSLMALTQVLMGNLQRNENRLMEMFNQELNNSQWDVKKKNQLLFNKSLLLLAIKRNSEAVDNFCHLYEEDETCLTFDDIPYQNRRYGWSNTNLRLNSIKFTLIDMKKTDRARKNGLEQILEKVKEAERKEGEYLRAIHQRNRKW